MVITLGKTGVWFGEVCVSVLYWTTVAEHWMTRFAGKDRCMVWRGVFFCALLDDVCGALDDSFRWERQVYGLERCVFLCSTGRRLRSTG